MTVSGSYKWGAIVQLFSAYSNTLFALVSGLFFVPLYLNSFGMHTYGSWLAAGNFLSMIAIFEGGLVIVFSQRATPLYTGGKYDDFARITGAGILITIFTSTFILLLSAVLVYWVPYIVKAEAADVEGIRWAFLLSAIGNVLMLQAAFFGALTRTWNLNGVPYFINLSSALIGLFSIYFLLEFTEAGIISLGIGALLKSGINFLGNIFFIVRSWIKLKLPKLTFNLRESFTLLRSMSALFASNVLSVILNNSKETFLILFVSPTSVAVFSLTAKLFTLVTMVLNPIGNSLFTLLSGLSTDAKRFMSWITRLFKFHDLLSGLMYGICVSINYYFVTVWVGADKFGGVFLSVFLASSAWLVSKCSLDIIVLNSKGVFFKATKIFSIEMFVRVLLVVSLLISGIEFKIIYLPIIETITLFGSFMYLQGALNSSRLRGIFKQISLPFLGTLLFFLGAAVILHYLFLQLSSIGVFRNDPWLVLVTVALMSTAIYIFAMALSGDNRKLFREIVSQVSVFRFLGKNV